MCHYSISLKHYVSLFPLNYVLKIASIAIILFAIVLTRKTSFYSPGFYLSKIVHFAHFSCCTMHVYSRHWHKFLRKCMTNWQNRTWFEQTWFNRISAKIQFRLMLVDWAFVMKDNKGTCCLFKFLFAGNWLLIKTATK